MRSRWLALAVAVSMYGALGCQGSISEPPRDRPDPIDPPIVCDDATLRPGRAPLRRLTVTEYDNSIQDILGDTTGPATRIVDGERGVLLADSRTVTPLLAEQYMRAAEDVAARLTAPAAIDGLLECDRAVTGDDGCARQLVERLAPKLYRRPADAAEIDGLYALYEMTKAEGFEIGIATVLEGMLQSPGFLYRAEFVDGTGDEVVRLDGYAVATRLSYFFWRTTPDETLLAAAAAGELDDDAGVEAQARRLVMHPRAEQGIQAFVARYLELDKLVELEKDTDLFPQWNENVPDLFRQETDAFVSEVVANHGASFETLMTASWTMMNAELATYYDMPGPGGSEFVRVDLDPQYFSGIMTQGGTTSIRARTYETSPIHRGMFIRGTVMCGVVPDVPEGLDVTPPDPDPTLTTRERLARHRESAECAACHDQLDPLGFAFEHFDAAGRFRMDENGLPIDATGDLVGSDNAGSFDGVPSLSRRLLDSREVHECFVQRWYPAAFGRGPEREDSCSMQELADRFAEAELDIRELLVALATSDPFLYRVADQDRLTEVTP